MLLSYNSLRLLLSGLCKCHTEGVCGLLNIAEAPVSLHKVVMDLYKQTCPQLVNDELWQPPLHILID